MGAILLEFELKHAIATSGGLGSGAGAPGRKNPLDRNMAQQKRIGLLSLEIATALGFNARHV